MTGRKSKKRARLMKLDDRARALASFGGRLRKLRIEKGFTPTEFAAKSGIDRGNLRKYENGREPGLIVMLIMAKTLEVSLGELVGFEFEWELEW